MVRRRIASGFCFAGFVALLVWPRGQSPAITAQSQRSDTVVIANARPLHGREGSLVLEATFGRRGSSDPQYSIAMLRDLAVAANGSVYILDYHRLAGEMTIRHFDAAGRFVRAVGRPGPGPGEFLNPTSIAIDRGGNVVVYSNRRVERYDSGGKPLGRISLEIMTSISSSSSLLVDTSGVFWIMINVLPPGLLPPGAPINATVFQRLEPAWQRVTPNGRVIDTVFRPTDGQRPSARVPFVAEFHHALSPLGYVVTGVGSRYSIDLRKPRTSAGALAVWRNGDPVISMRRDYTPVPLPPGEFDDWAASRSAASGRGALASAAAGAPPVTTTAPRVKPAFGGIAVGADGRIWVSILAAAQENRAIDAASVPPARYAALRWPAPILFDIFEPDGRYVGRLRYPESLRRATIQFRRGDHVWLSVPDENDEVVVQRYRITW